MESKIITRYPFNLKKIHTSWKNCVEKGLDQVNPLYLQRLTLRDDWLPGPDKIFNAFSIPLNDVKYVLFGESPYPRKESANGYAFWDAAVKEIWSEYGLSKSVNRATSLRNLIKMLLIAEGYLKTNQVTQADIASIDKTGLVETLDELFENFLAHGFLLLNATPVLQTQNPQKDAKAWSPFTKEVLTCLIEKKPKTTLVLFGRIANNIIDMIPGHQLPIFCSEHPYNHSFICNETVLRFFKGFHLLNKPTIVAHQI